MSCRHWIYFFILIECFIIIFITNVVMIISITYILEGLSNAFKTPCVVFTGHPSLRFGDVVHFIELWGQGSGNTMIFIGEYVGNKAKGRNSKRVFQENKTRQIFRKTNISYTLTPFSDCFLAPYPVLKRCFQYFLFSWRNTIEHLTTS